MVAEILGAVRLCLFLHIFIIVKTKALPKINLFNADHIRSIRDVRAPSQGNLYLRLGTVFAQDRGLDPITTNRRILLSLGMPIVISPENVYSQNKYRLWIVKINALCG